MLWQKIKYVVLGLFLSGISLQVWATTDVMELDGNVKSDGALDWIELNDPNFTSEGLANVNVVARFFEKDKGNGTDKIFWKGGSKDELDITKWAFRSGSPQPKDDFTNAYATAIENGDGDTLLYFGADRYANNGDMYIGFWLLQADVGIPNTARGSFTDGSYHIPGDTLILVSFPQASGGNPYIEVFEWVSSGGDVSENLSVKYSTPGDPKDAGFVGALCQAGNPGDTALVCAISNSELTIGSIEFNPDYNWTYQAKTGETDEIPYESFVEGRLNLTQLFGADDVPCFSSFLVESRASRSLDAALADFVYGGFDLCKVLVSLSCDSIDFLSNGEFNIDYTITLTNGGPGKLSTSGTAEIKSSSWFGEIVENFVVEDSDGDGYWSVNETVTISDNYDTTKNGANGPIDSGFVLIGDTTIQLIPEDPANTDYVCDGVDISPMLEVSKVCDTFLKQEGTQFVLKQKVDIEACNTSRAPIESLVITDRRYNPNASEEGFEDFVLLSDKTLDFAQECDPNASQEGDDGYCGDLNECVYISGEEPDKYYGCRSKETQVWIGTFGLEDGVCTQASATFYPDFLPNNDDGEYQNVAIAEGISFLAPDAEDSSEVPDKYKTKDMTSPILCALCPLPVVLAGPAN